MYFEQKVLSQITKFQHFVGREPKLGCCESKLFLGAAQLVGVFNRHSTVFHNIQ